MSFMGIRTYYYYLRMSSKFANDSIFLHYYLRTQHNFVDLYRKGIKKKKEKCHNTEKGMKGHETNIFLICECHIFVCLCVFESTFK